MEFFTSQKFGCSSQQNNKGQGELSFKKGSIKQNINAAIAKTMEINQVKGLNS